MHEFAIVSEILTTVLHEAGAKDATSIKVVEIEVGELKQIVPKFINTAWESITKGTIAESSKLEFKEVDILVKCINCGNVYKAQIDDFVCCKCSKANAQIIQGDDIILKSITCEVDE